MIARQKIIQIVALPGDEEYNRCIIALCDDGTVWEKTLIVDKNGKEPDWDLIETKSMNR